MFTAHRFAAVNYRFIAWQVYIYECSFYHEHAWGMICWDCLFGDNCNAHVLSKTSMHMMALLKKLQAFEPPFYMSQYVDTGGHDHPSNMHNHSHVDCTHSSGRGDCLTISISKNNSSLDEEHDNPREGAKTHESSRETDYKKARPIWIIRLYTDYRWVLSCTYHLVICCWRFQFFACRS